MCFRSKRRWYFHSDTQFSAETWNFVEVREVLKRLRIRSAFYLSSWVFFFAMMNAFYWSRSLREGCHRFWRCMFSAFPSMQNFEEISSGEWIGQKAKVQKSAKSLVCLAAASFQSTLAFAKFTEFLSLLLCWRAALLNRSERRPIALVWRRTSTERRCTEEEFERPQMKWENIIIYVCWQKRIVRENGQCRNPMTALLQEKTSLMNSHCCFCVNRWVSAIAARDC